MSPASKLELLSAAEQKIGKASGARARLAKLFDENTFVEIDAFAKSNGDETAVVTGYGAIDGSTVFAFCQDSEVKSGAVDMAHAAKIKKIYELAVKTGAPVVGVYDSKGADMASAYSSMSAYGELFALSNNISGVVPQVALILGTCAGSATLMAGGADFIVMSKTGEFFLTPPSVASKEEGYEKFAGSASNAAASGVAHIVAESDDKAIASVRKIISMLPLNNLSEAPIWDFAESDNSESILTQACENGADISAVAAAIADKDSVIELQNAFGKNAFASIATIGGQACGIVGACGSLGADECTKLARTVSICDAFSLPVVTLVDTEGFTASSKEALSGSIRDAAMLAHVYAEATCPKLSLVIGKAYGSAYIALAGKGGCADIALAWPSAVIAPLAPSAMVAFMHNDRVTAEKSRAQVEAEYSVNEAGALALAAEGQLDAVINPANTRGTIISYMDMLAGKRVNKLPKKHSNMPL